MIQRKPFSHLGFQKANSLTGQVLSSIRTWQTMGEVTGVLQVVASPCQVLARSCYMR